MTTGSPTPPVEVPPLDPAVYALLGEFPRELFGERFYRSWELVDRYGQQQAIRIARELGLEEALAVPATTEELLARRGFVPALRAALEGLLRQLVALDLVEETLVEASGERGATPRYHRRRPFAEPPLAALREACLAVDAANAPALDLLDLAASAWPAIAAGRTTGQEALFGLGQTRLWLAYFSNQNPTYAINNRLAAIAAVHRLPGGPLRILEIGGGGGSASEALLEALAAAGRLGDVALYRFTEPSPFFRRGAERKLRGLYPALPLEVAALDVDQPLAAQGVADASWELVYGANVLHVARDLPRTLAGLHAALAPGGALVAAEAMRNHAREPVSTELVFLVLESYWNVVLDPVRRPVPGFLSPPLWRQLLREAGFADVEVVPDHARIREVYPRFSTGVLCGRRPA